MRRRLLVEETWGGWLVAKWWWLKLRLLLQRDCLLAAILQLLLPFYWSLITTIFVVGFVDTCPICLTQKPLRLHSVHKDAWRALKHLSPSLIRRRTRHQQGLVLKLCLRSRSAINVQLIIGVAATAAP